MAALRDQLAALSAQHVAEMEAAKRAAEETLAVSLSEAAVDKAQALAALESRLQALLDTTVQDLKAEAAAELAALSERLERDKAHALASLEASLRVRMPQNPKHTQKSIILLDTC